MPYPQFRENYITFLKHLKSFDKRKGAVLKQAYQIAKREHQGQKKFGLYPYIIHVLAIFNFLFAKLKIKDINILTSALLHDTVEDGKITLLEIEKIFGQKVYAIMETITRFRSPQETELEKAKNKYRHFIKVSKGSYGARIIKLADFYDNMKNWLVIPPKNHNRQKFPRWLKEAEKHLTLARKTNKTMLRIMKEELKHIKIALAKTK